MNLQIIAGVIVFGFAFVIGFVSLMEWANISRHKELLKKLEDISICRENIEAEIQKLKEGR